MSGRQKLILTILAVFMGAQLCVATLMVRSFLLNPASRTAALPTPTLTRRPQPTPASTLVPTWTPTPLPLETPAPTATATRVVSDTETPTATPTATNTLVLATAGPGRSGSGTGVPLAAPKNLTPTATPTPAHPMKLVAGQVYTTSNYFFVVYAQIKTGDTLLSDYRIVGTHVPSNMSFESPPSCNNLCKANGPHLVLTPCCNEKCTPEATSLPPYVQEGNVAFEAMVYETGTYYIWIVNPQGERVSDTYEIPIDINDRKWFFYVFAQ